MAASPPPYSPPSPPNDPRQQKAYWRAQKDALRGQRDYWRSQRRDQRYYWRSMHRSSIVGPILILVVGVVALLIETGKLSNSVFWEWFVRWWPLLFVLVGAASLLEWFLDRGQPYRRKSGAFGIVLLIAILVGIAYSQDHMHHAINGFGWQSDDNWPNFMGDDHDHDADSNTTIPATASVQVQNPHGDVTLTGSGDNQLHVHVHQVVNTNSDSEANRIFPSLDPKVTVSGNTVLVRIEGRNNGHADLTIELPEGVSTDITAGHGDVSVEGLKGATGITAGHGDVKVTSLGGSVHAHMSKGDFAAHEIGGSVTLDGRVSDVTISEVRGSLLMDGDFFGDIHIEQIASSLHFHSSRTSMDMARLAGDLTMDDDDLHVGQAVGPLRILTRSKNIDCSQVSGDIHIENSNGDVAVNAIEPLGNIQINNSSDPVTLTLPPNAGFQINAGTDNGDLNSDFELNISGDDRRRNANGTVGKGGPKIDVMVRHGDLTLKKGDANTPPMPPMPPFPIAPPAPKAPAPPSGSMKHLRPPADAKAEPNVL